MFVTKSGASARFVGNPGAGSMQRELLCTIGPASRDPRVLARLAALGASLFRINLSHTALEDVAAAIDHIQGATDVPVCLDTEGAQIRTGRFVHGPVVLKSNSNVQLARGRVPGDAQAFNLHPIEMVEALRPGDFVSVDFDSVLLQVVEVREDGAQARVLNGGNVGSFKAVTVQREIDMPPLSAKDLAALELGRQRGVRHVALSFANRGEDVAAIRAVAGADVIVISKIETRRGIANLADIARLSDAVLIDRGDLSRQVPLEHIPRAQKHIIRTAKRLGRKVYVATNLLESMITAAGPTRAEVNDVYNTLLDGADGLVLAAETAIGARPVRCADMIVRMIRTFERHDANGAAGQAPIPGLDLLADPGVDLVPRTMPLDDAAERAVFQRIVLGETDLLDCEQLAIGTYAPVDGFMDRAALDTVLHQHCLPDGSPWTLPIVLQVDPAQGRDVAANSWIGLCDGAGTLAYLLEVSESEAFDPAPHLVPWFGTDDARHPGVARLLSGGRWRLAGRVHRIATANRPRPYYQLAPAESRYIFAQKGWSRVVGFHTRNAAHRVHEYLQLRALETTGADGLYISPVLGPKKPGDFLPGPIMRSYELLLDFGVYPREQVVLGSFATYSRYAGPREAVFTALCRRNMGCTHFIVGRDHTGVGDFYAPEAGRRLFEALGDLGIEPVFFDEVGYSTDLRRYGTEAEIGRLATISGTEVRRCLKEGRRLPDWFMRDVVQDSLQAEIARGRPVFQE